MSAEHPASPRRQFLKWTAAGLLTAPAALRGAEPTSSSSSPASTAESAFSRTAPDLLRGEVLRTEGKLLPEGKWLQESQREIPVAGRSQVLVCGGGPAGIAAALAAARAGADTQLLEIHGCLGGVWTAGMLTKILDAENKSGLMREILTLMKERGSDVARQTNGTTYDPELMKLVLEEMCVAAGVKIQLHTQIVGAAVDSQNRLQAVITESKSGRQAWRADRFIDCTGDGDLAAHAGCRFDVGVDASCTCQPMSMMALLVGPDPEKITPFIREISGGAAKQALLAEMRKAGLDPSYRAPTLRHLHSGIFSLMSNHEYSVPAFDAGAITAATIQSRAEVHATVRALRSLGGEWSQLAVVATAEQIGIREGRRIKGRYEITTDDLLTGARFDDAICRAKFPIDVHALELQGDLAYWGVVKGKRAQPYDIPLRALIAADVEGLMMAGRCISGDFIAHASYRVTGNSVPMGEAAGRVSALSIEKNVMPHEVDWKEVTA